MKYEPKLLDDDMVDAFLKDFKAGVRPKRKPLRVQMDKLKRSIIQLYREKYKNEDIAAMFSERFLMDVTVNDVLEAVKDELPPKIAKIPSSLYPTRGSRKKRTAAPSAGNVSETSSSNDVGVGSPTEDTGAISANITSDKAAPENNDAEIRPLDNAQEWRETGNSVVLKDAVPVPAGVRIKTLAGRIAEVTVCKPCTYGSGFSRRDGMEVFYKFLS